ncbi:non-specific lipid-transfer protein 1-like isoform X2 [Mangifera indica]|uniref:non-specific lipid-transfer protein 1-like isoform X2 n=1 Tax=Mangifera indica TaxID=29780 RepID=UPI001CFB2EFA|nr:non-specific lipid-transfer protein 1-like isoform X2 [Mangifera indica]
MASSQILKVAFIAVLIVSMLMGGGRVGAKITCEQVTIWLTPCIGYGVMGGPVPVSCCQGIRALNAASNTTEDRQAQCNCVKEGAAKIPGLDYDRVNTLPGICGSNCPYKLTHDLDCSKVK